MRSLKDKVVVITGASRGIGAAIARVMAGQEAQLVLCGRNKKNLQNVASSLNLSRGNFVTVTADVSKASGMARIVRTAYDKFGRVDVFVNNAGVGIGKLFIRTTEKEFDTVINTNLKSVFYCFKELLPRLQKQGGGQIINVSSMAAKQGTPGLSVYSASKAAVNVLSEAVAGEVRNENIKICVLAPASVETGFMSNLAPRARASSKAARKLAVEEVADAVLFLARQNENAWVSLAEIRPLFVRK
ncbi:MAG TPA: SDR family oxidoreductase [Acidobacteriota bacterium]|nr:SDR family oxidoreductase [Acidobacteriota bacterium]